MSDRVSERPAAGMTHPFRGKSVTSRAIRLPSPWRAEQVPRSGLRCDAPRCLGGV